MITHSNRLTLTEGRGAHDKGQVTEEPCDGKLSRTVLKGRREVAISPADPNKWMVGQLEQLAPVTTIYGYQTANTREHLGLVKNKADKSKAEFTTHAVDGVAIAASHFVEYRQYHKIKESGGNWFGSVAITSVPFFVIRRPPYSRRQLHLMVPAKGGIRRKYGGSTTRHDVRKGDLVNSPKGIGYVSGDTDRQISVSDANWKRLGQIASSKVTLIRRSNGFIVSN
ncbi:hypothetical protein ACE1CI_26745 [Aerosakkonemataceae cyanobacterium BLCC-F50]|uniref:Uncharacterized protein n=1 Tax=Floridaenema flaviceps BLCC-F50 TaxID=3153642 RepID=A0ABV4XXW6_9CYAN